MRYIPTVFLAVALAASQVTIWIQGKTIRSQRLAMNSQFERLTANFDRMKHAADIAQQAADMGNKNSADCLSIVHRYERLYR